MMSTAQPNTDLSAWLRDAVTRGREDMRARLAEGGGGVEVCNLLSDVYDEAISQLWTRMADEFGADELSELSLVATGGWGRREVCPYSDIDFILLAPRARTELAKEVSSRMLYSLWDARVDVGHAVRDVKSTASLAKEDLATATALLDVRYVVGAEKPAADLQVATRKIIAPGGNANKFVAKLVREQLQRHERFGDSVYLLEPNLKQGYGALRDLATAVWTARARWDVHDVFDLVRMGQLSSRQAAVITAARDFLLKLRTMLQLNVNRKTDQLTFEIQESIGPVLYPDATLPEGDIRPAVTPAVEALMRRYYLHARGVVRVTERLLDLAMVPARRKPRIARIDGTFLTFNGRLAVHDPNDFRSRPAEMVRLFRVALELGTRIYGHTKELIADYVSTDGNRLTGNPEAARHFLDALIDNRDTAQPSLLEQMHGVGLLNVLMPEFAPCTCRVQHDLYHVYTVDQHQLYAVAMLKQLARGDLVGEHPTATAAMASVQEPETLYLATLLHDVGKPLGKGHAEKGARLAHTIARRLHMTTEQADRVEYLVRQHLTMSHLSQRRDLSDPQVIERFASRIGDEEALVQLYLLTLVDTAMTAPGNFNAWKAQLLRELFTRTREFLRGGTVAAAVDPSADLNRVRQRAIELLVSGEDSMARADAEQFLGALDDKFFVSLSPRQVARHVRLARSLVRSNKPVEISIGHYPMKGHSEVAIVAKDKHGLLGAFAGVLAANRVNILAAVVGGRVAPAETGGAAIALDLFYVRDLVGNAIPADDPRWPRISEDLTKLLEGEVDGAEIDALLTKRRPKSSFDERVTPGVPTEIKIHNDASEAATVVEVFARDQVGVLSLIAHALADLKLDIHLAKVVTEGERVADIFYVTRGDEEAKIEAEAELAEIRSRLIEALETVADE